MYILIRIVLCFHLWPRVRARDYVTSWMAIFRPQHVLCCVGFLAVTVYLYLQLQWDTGPGSPYNRYKPVFLPPETRNDLPIILWWTPFTPYQRVVRDCKLGKCLITHSRTEVGNPNTDAIVFEGTMMNWKDLPLPRSSRHLWALLHDESPRNNWPLVYEEGISLFNVTSTCSRYSHFPLVSRHLDTIKRLACPVRVPTSQKSKGDVGLVMYLYSNCNPPSDRDTYVKELMKYVKVDSYGRCLHNKDLPEHLLNPLTFSSEEIFQLHAKYKFSISFENAICEDYITEKFWRPLVAGSVPIVRGSPTILDWAPDVEHSIIVADHFSTPKNLADYLLYLDQNDEEYEKYLEFKRSGVTNKRLLDHMTQRLWEGGHRTSWHHDFTSSYECFVCDTVLKRKQEAVSGMQPIAMVASHQHFNCAIPFPSLLVPRQPGDQQEDAMSVDVWRQKVLCHGTEVKRISDIIARGGGTQEEVNAVLHCERL